MISLIYKLIIEVPIFCLVTIFTTIFSRYFVYLVSIFFHKNTGSSIKEKKLSTLQNKECLGAKSQYKKVLEVSFAC